MRKILIYLFAFAFLANSSYAGITFWTTEVQPARMEKQWLKLLKPSQVLA